MLVPIALAGWAAAASPWDAARAAAVSEAAAAAPAAPFQYGPFGALSVDQAVQQAAKEEEGQIEAQYYKDNAAAVAEWNKENKEIYDGEKETKAEEAFTLPSLLRGGLRATAAAAPAAAAKPAPLGALPSAALKDGAAALPTAALAARAPVALAAPAPATLPTVLLDTTAGGIALRVRTDKAPGAGGEFLQLVARGLYDGCAIYRAETFVIQGGLRTPDGQVRENPIGPFPLETGLSNRKGTLALARWTDPNSATGEFFVNLQDNLSFDSTGPGSGFGVFAEVAEGMDIAEQISRMAVHQGTGMHMLDKPVVIRSARAA